MFGSIEIKACNMSPKGIGCLAISALWPTQLSKSPETCMFAWSMPMQGFDLDLTSINPSSLVLTVGDFVAEAFVGSMVGAFWVYFACGCLDLDQLGKTGGLEMM